MANDPILHLLGLAKKAGRLEIGEEPVGALCRARHARLILLASDAAPNTRRRCAHFGEIGNVLWLELPDGKSCRVVVPDDQLSLAIGKEGQNARLAARLTGYKIDIKPESYQGEDDEEIVDEEPVQ